MKRRLIEGQSEDGDDWSTGHPVIFPNILRVGRGVHHSFQYRVPVDDENTLYIWYNCYIPKMTTLNYQGLSDHNISSPFPKENGDYIDDFVAGQDIMCWITQGAIADRRTEHLGTSDKGIILYRQLLTEQMEKVKTVKSQ